MTECPYCGRSFNSQKGVSVHLHSCPKCSGFDMYMRGQGTQRRNESDKILKPHWEDETMRLRMENYTGWVSVFEEQVTAILIMAVSFIILLLKFSWFYWILLWT